MTRLACALLLLAVATCSASQTKIVGGNDASIEKYPSIVQVQSPIFIGVWTQTCGASILTSRFIVSNGGCFSGLLFSVRLRRIVAGSTYRNTGGLVSNVAQAFVHPSFNEDRSRDGDISVVLLETPLVFSNVVQQATIIAQGVVVPDNLRVTQVGWGLTLEELPGIRAEVLQEVSVLTANNAACAETYANSIIPRTVTENMICTTWPDGGAGACVGDAGGPLYFGNIVVGIISWGMGCRNTTLPNVHTAVSSYTEWIVQTAV